MVSENTKNSAELVKKSIQKNGINASDLSDLHDLALYAIESEHDAEWALRITKYVKSACDWELHPVLMLYVWMKSTGKP